MITRILVVVVSMSVLLAACSGGAGEAATCEDVAVQTIELLQELIDDVDAEFESMSIEEFIANGDNLPSVGSFRDQSEAIEQRSEELNCSQQEIAAGVAARVGDLTAETRLGQFVITLLVSGDL